jgi:CheY-like chemotaxis protein
VKSANRVSGKRVLIVEDEYFTAMELARSIEALGAIPVGPVADAEGARDMLSTEAVDAVLLDINLAGVLSYSLADELRSRGVPFAFVTGYQGPAIPARFATMPRCEKPFDAEELRRLLESI